MNNVPVENEFPAGMQMMEHNSKSVLVYVASKTKDTRYITRDMFTQLSGGIAGAPPLVKLSPNKECNTVAGTSTGVKITFTHMWVAQGGIVTYLLGEFIDVFEDIKWTMGTFPGKITDMFMALVSKKGYKLLFPRDQQQAEEVFELGKGAVNINANNINNNQTTKITPSPYNSDRRPTSNRRSGLVAQLNADYKLADKLSLQELENIIREAEDIYNNAENEDSSDQEEVLDDGVYDYIKDLYRALALEKGIINPALLNPNIGKFHVPANQANADGTQAARFLKAPIWMGSLDKMNHGDGKLSLWKGKFPGPYVVSAKMDGASSLYFYENGQYKLYGNSDSAGNSQNISELLQYLNLPTLEPGILIRGEVILKKSLFNAKYKRENRLDKSDKTKYRNIRNAVGGLVNKVGARAGGSKKASEPLDVAFIHELDFIAYEVIVDLSNPVNMGPNARYRTQMKCSEQFDYLVKLFLPNMLINGRPSNGGVAPFLITPTIDDAYLSALFDYMLANVDYMLDGLVVCSDAQAYDRVDGENPSYARAYKKPLTVLTGTTTIIAIEWNVSKDWLWKPTVIFNPVELDGSCIERATGHNAKIIVENKIGPGAIVEITRAGGVIPHIIRATVIPAPADANGVIQGQLPNGPHKWNSSGVELIADQTDPIIVRGANIKKIKHFLKKIGAKGIGPARIAQMYDIGVTSIPALFQLQPHHIAFMGDKVSQNVVDAIKKGTSNLSLPLLGAAAGAFGKSIGHTLLEVVFAAYPNIMDSEAVRTNNIPVLQQAISQLPGFAELRTDQVAAGFYPFLQLIHQLLQVGYVVPVTRVKAPISAVASNHPLAGMNIVFTGFTRAREEEAAAFVESIGGKIQSGVTNATNILVTNDANASESGKTKAARAKGITIMSRADFVRLAK